MYFRLKKRNKSLQEAKIQNKVKKSIGWPVLIIIGVEGNLIQTRDSQTRWPVVAATDRLHCH